MTEITSQHLTPHLRMSKEIMDVNPLPALVLRRESTTSRRFKVDHINQQTAIELGEPVQNLIGKDVAEILRHTPSTQTENLFTASLRTANLIGTKPLSEIPKPKIDIRTADGQIKKFEVLPREVVQVINGRRRITGFEVVAYDITNIEVEKALAQEEATTAAALQKSSEVLARNLKLEDLLDNIENIIKEVIPHDTANIMLLGEKGAVHLNKTWGYKEKLVLDPDKPPAKNISERTTLQIMERTKKPLLIEDTKDTNRYPYWIPSKNGYAIRSYVGAPIVFGDKVLGFLSLNSQNPNHFTQKHTEILAALSEQIAVSIDNARTHKEVLDLSQIDNLTQVFNRRSFDNSIREESERAIRYRRPFSMLMVDIDFFKKFNDYFGHQPGDDRIHAVAQLLKRNTRNVDIVSRYGGEEFAIILPEINEVEALKVAMKILEEMRRNYSSEFGSTLSMGVASYPLTGEKELYKNITAPDALAKKIVQIADQNLYKAKKGPLGDTDPELQRDQVYSLLLEKYRTSSQLIRTQKGLDELFENIEKANAKKE